jgi:hypothetical protein
MNPTEIRLKPSRSQAQWLRGLLKCLGGLAVVEPVVSTFAFSTRPSLFTGSLARVILVAPVVAVRVALVNSGLRGTAIVVDVEVPDAGRVTVGVGGSAGMNPVIDAPNALPVAASGPVAAPAEPAKKAKEPRATPMASRTAPTRRNKPTGWAERTLGCGGIIHGIDSKLSPRFRETRLLAAAQHTHSAQLAQTIALISPGRRRRGSADRIDFPVLADIWQTQPI